MMNINMKYQWLKVLRNGRYQQTFGCLRDNDGFDVLGVLCDVFDHNNWYYPDGERMVEGCGGECIYDKCSYCGSDREHWDLNYIDVLDYHNNCEHCGKCEDCDVYWHRSSDIEPIKESDKRRAYLYHGHRYGLPDNISFGSGLFPDPTINGITLANLNDIHRLSFDKLADLIEEHL